MVYTVVFSVPVKCFIRLLLWWNRPPSHLRLLSSPTASQAKHVLKVNSCIMISAPVFFLTFSGLQHAVKQMHPDAVLKCKIHVPLIRHFITSDWNWLEKELSTINTTLYSHRKTWSNYKMYNTLQTCICLALRSFVPLKT